MIGRPLSVSGLAALADFQIGVFKYDANVERRVLLFSEDQALTNISTVTKLVTKAPLRFDDDRGSIVKVEVRVIAGDALGHSEAENFPLVPKRNAGSLQLLRYTLFKL